jgi:RHS repeat-associated protein
VYGHQGLRYNVVSGLYHTPGRDYSPALGRWTREDPITILAGDSNLYRFEGDSPAGGLDPLGLLDPRLTRPSCMVCHGGLLQGTVSYDDLSPGAKFDILRWNQGSYGPYGRFASGVGRSVSDTLDAIAEHSQTTTGNPDADFWQGVVGFWRVITNIPDIATRAYNAFVNDPVDATGYAVGMIGQGWITKKVGDTLVEGLAEVPNRTAVEALADSYRGSLKTGGPRTVAVLATQNGPFNGQSGLSGPTHPVVKQLLDNIKSKGLSEELFHGQCAEVDAVSKALFEAEERTRQKITTVAQARKVLSGSSMQTARVRGPNSSQHGTWKSPCDSCAPWLQALGISY